MICLHTQPGWCILTNLLCFFLFFPTGHWSVSWRDPIVFLEAQFDVLEAWQAYNALDIQWHAAVSWNVERTRIMVYQHGHCPSESTNVMQIGLQMWNLEQLVPCETTPEFSWSGSFWRPKPSLNMSQTNFMWIHLEKYFFFTNLNSSAIKGDDSPYERMIPVRS